MSRALEHVRGLWGRWWWAPGTLYTAYTTTMYVIGDLRFEHVLVTILVIVFSYANDLWVVPREGGEARAKRRGGGPSSHSHPAPDARRRVPRIVIDERDRHRTRRGRGPSSDVRASRDGRERRGGPSPRDDQRRVTFNTPPNTRHDAHTR